MKKNFLLLLLVIPGYTAFAVEKSSIQTQAPVVAQVLPQITSQTVTPTTSQEAITACSGLYEKDSCQFHTSSALVNGICKILPSGNNNYKLGCQPEQSTKNAATDQSKDVPKEPHQHKHKRS